MSIIMPINTVKVYYNSVLILYAKELVLKAVVAIFIMSITVNKWLKALLASSILVKVALSDMSFLKVIKQVIKNYFSFFSMERKLFTHLYHHNSLKMI